MKKIRPNPFLTILLAGLLVWLPPALAMDQDQALNRYQDRNQNPPGLIITPDMQFSYARSLFESGDHTAAQVEFKRFIHFFPEDPRVGEARFKTAMALFHSEKFHEAAKMFNRIILDSDDTDPHARESYFMQSRSFSAMGNSGYAQIVLQNFLKLTRDPSTQDRIYLELARLHIRESMQLEKNGLDEAEKYLTLISPANTAAYRVAPQLRAIERAKAAPRKSPSLAGVLAIIPGGGMLYCERYKDAFVSFCLNAGLMYAAYEAFNQDNPALGGVISFVGAGLYAGSIYGSVGAAHKYNRASQIRILNREFSLGAGIDPASTSFVLTFNHRF